MFDGESPCVARGLLLTSEDLHVWDLARARGIAYVTSLRLYTKCEFNIGHHRVDSCNRRGLHLITWMVCVCV